jgi:hypothetical protein
MVAIFKPKNFLNIGKNRITLTIKSADKKGRLLTELTFFFASLWKCKLLNPRCARYAWGKRRKIQFLVICKLFKLGS